MFLRSKYVICSFVLLKSITLYRYTTFLFFHSLADKHLNSFHFLGIMNTAAVKNYIQVFFSFFLGIIPKTIIRSCGKFLFKYIRNCQLFLRSAYLYMSTVKSMSVPVSPHPCLYLLFSFFLIKANQ